jgi:hypothetical protein
MRRLRKRSAMSEGFFRRLYASCTDVRKLKCSANAHLAFYKSLFPTVGSIVIARIPEAQKHSSTCAIMYDVEDRQKKQEYPILETDFLLKFVVSKYRTVESSYFALNKTIPRRLPTPKQSLLQ